MQESQVSTDLRNAQIALEKATATVYAEAMQGSLTEEDFKVIEKLQLLARNLYDN